jgi:hypothetical protein
MPRQTFITTVCGTAADMTPQGAPSRLPLHGVCLHSTSCVTAMEALLPAQAGISPGPDPAPGAKHGRVANASDAHSGRYPPGGRGEVVPTQHGPRPADTVGAVSTYGTRRKVSSVRDPSPTAVHPGSA